MVWIEKQRMDHSIIANHEINSSVPCSFRSITNGLTFGIECKMEYHRIGLGNVCIYLVKYLFNSTFNTSSMEMPRTEAVINDGIYCHS